LNLLFSAGNIGQALAGTSVDVRKRYEELVKAPLLPLNADNHLLDGVRRQPT